MNILFVCKYNRFRSKIAESYFNKINKNKKNKAKSAGLIKGSTYDELQVRVAGEFGIKFKGKPQGLSTKLMRWQNMIVVVANDVPAQIFADNEKYRKNLAVWEIPDAKTDEKSETEAIIMLIMSKIDRLVEELK